MEGPGIRPDLLFCRKCAKHFRGQPRECPNGCGPIEPVSPFRGTDGDVVDDRYILVEQIGIGGMGTVYRAEDMIANREVALKVLNAKYASHAASARRFFREARMMRAVSHTCATGLHRFGPTREGLLLIDMEYVPGRTVRDQVLENGSGLEVESALAVLDNVLAALGACHDAGVVHCDVKPENVVLVRDGARGQCKLVDFGIAQPPGAVEHSDEFVVLGTPAFMSPEQVRCLTVDARTDLYLVGCLAYELLTGDPPFVGDGPLDLCQQQMLDPPPALSSRMDVDRLPPGFVDLVGRLLEKSPQMRPASARVVREELRTMRRRWRDVRGAAWLAPGSYRPPSRGRVANANRRITDRPRLDDRPFSGLRALIEVRQVFEEGTVYGPKALEEIASHVFTGTMNELRELGAEVSGPNGPHIEIGLPCEGDERGAVSHLLDCLAELNEVLGRIPEPKLEIRAAVLATADAEAVHLGPQPALDLLGLLNIGPGSYVRCDARVARWAGRRQIVRLGDVREAGGEDVTALYATSLMAS